MKDGNPDTPPVQTIQERRSGHSKLVVRDGKIVSEKAKMWLSVQLDTLVQDVNGVEVDGQFYPPTFHWYGNLTGYRSDGKSYYVKLRIPPDSGMAQVGVHLVMALEQLNSYLREP